MKRSLVVAIVAGLTGGCGVAPEVGVTLPCDLRLPAISGKIDPADSGWTVADIENNQYSNASSARQVKVSISELVSDDDSLNGQISRQIRDDMAGVVSSAGAGIIDRSVSAALQSEIIAAERANQRISSARSNSIDFALVGTITEPTYSAEPGVVNAINRLALTASGKKTQRGDPLCKYEAIVRGSLKLYRIASREVVREWALEGKSSETELNPDGASCTRGVVNRNSLIGKAAKSAIDKVQNEPLPWLRPVGYVLERKEDSNGRSIFRTSIGTGAGILNARSVSVIQKQPFDDPIQKRTVIDEVRLVQDATILREHVNDQYSWIHVKDEAKAKAIKVGDVVEQKGTCS